MDLKNLLSKRALIDVMLNLVIDPFERILLNNDRVKIIIARLQK